MPAAGNPAYNPDFSHTMLVVVLMKHGGSILLQRTELTPTAAGDDDDMLYRIALEPLPDNTFRLSVVPTAAAGAVR
jgi:hypothetical protein